MDNSKFPILIEITYDAKGWKSGTEITVMTPEEIPSGVPFKVLKTGVKVSNLPREYLNNRAYMDVLNERGMTMVDDVYLECYRFWYPLGNEYRRELEHSDDLND